MKSKVNRIANLIGYLMFMNNNLKGCTISHNEYKQAKSALRELNKTIDSMNLVNEVIR